MKTLRALLAHPLLRALSRPVLYLLAFALAGTLLLAGINTATEPRIAANERKALLQRIDQLLAGQTYDNDPLQDSVVITDNALSGTPVTVYRIRQQNVPLAAVYDLTTPNGYSGSIRLVVGINNAQSISGVRVVSHRETPGLGDKIELSKHDWILRFNGRSLRDPAPEQWAVRKDGGVFDQFTGATITPRAIVSAVRDILLWTTQHQQNVFTRPSVTANHKDAN